MVNELPGRWTRVGRFLVGFAGFVAGIAAAATFILQVVVPQREQTIVVQMADLLQSRGSISPEAAREAKNQPVGEAVETIAADVVRAAAVPTPLQDEMVTVREGTSVQLTPYRIPVGVPYVDDGGIRVVIDGKPVDHSMQPGDVAKFEGAAAGCSVTYMQATENYDGVQLLVRCVE